MDPKEINHPFEMIHDKMQIARRIVICNDINPAYKGVRDKVITYYTGVSKAVVNEVLNNKKTSTSFLEWRQQKMASAHNSVVLYEHMKQVIADQYMNELQLPTKLTITKAIHKMGYDGYPNILVEKDLLALGFIWKRLPKINKYIIVENNEQVFRRMKYLQKMKEYRKKKTVIVYIEAAYFVAYDKNGAQQSTPGVTGILAASPVLGAITAFFPSAYQNTIEEFWLRDKLLSLPANTLIVIEQSPQLDVACLCDLPASNSNKSHMKEWLDFYNIEYDPDAHKSELYRLIEKFKVQCPPRYKCCEMFHAMGHETILRPPELSYMKYFDTFIQDMNENTTHNGVGTIKPNIVTCMNKVTPEEWLEKDRIVAEKEKAVFEEDRKLEIIFDDLMESTKNIDMLATDFVDCEPNGFDTEFYDSIVCK